jgi:hypothetical protein
MQIDRQPLSGTAANKIQMDITTISTTCCMWIIYLKYVLSYMDRKGRENGKTERIERKIGK